MAVRRLWWVCALVGMVGLLLPGCRSARPAKMASRAAAVRLRLNIYPAPGQAMAFSPDGRLAVIGRGVWDAHTWQFLRLLPEERTNGVPVFSPDSKTLALLVNVEAPGMKSYAVHLYDVATGTLRREIRGHSYLVQSVAFSPDGLSIATGGADATLKVWDARTGALRWLLVMPETYLTAVAFSPNGKWLAGVCARGAGGSVMPGQPVNFDFLTIWDARTGAEVRRLSTREYGMTALAFSPDSTRIAAPGWNPAGRLTAGKVTCWNVRTGAPVKTLAISAPVNDLAFAPDGKTFACADSGGISLWDVHMWKLKRRIARQHGHLAYTPDGRWLACGEWLLHGQTGAPARRLRPPALTAAIRALAVAPDGTTAVTGGADGAVRLWNLRTGALLWTVADQPPAVTAAAFTPSGATAISGNEHGVVRMWDVKTGARRRVLTGHTAAVTALVCAPNSAWLASGSQDASVRLWDLHTGALQRTLAGLGGAITALAVSPDGRLLAAGSDDGSVMVWDFAAEALQRLTGFTRPVDAVAFTADGKYLVTGGGALAGQRQPAEVMLWETRTWTLQRALKDVHAPITAVAVAPDGQRVAGAGGDDAVTVWNANNGKVLRTLAGHVCGANVLAYLPDGRLLAGGGDGILTLWDARHGRPLAGLLAFPRAGDGTTPWLTYTAGNYYTGSPGVETWMSWELGGKSRPAEPYIQTYRKPEMVVKALKGR